MARRSTLPDLNVEAGFIEWIFRLHQASSLMHDAKNINHDITASIQLLTKKSTQIDRRIGRALDASRALGDILHEASSILSGAREDTKRKPTLIVRAVREALATTHQMLEYRRARLSTRLPSHDFPVLLSRAEVKFIIQSLASNSLDAGAKRIRVYLSQKKVDGRSIILRFRDDGHGISREQLPNVSRSFFTTKSNRDGLGLTVARRLVERLGGRMDITSDRGRGTSVAITINVVESDSR